MDDLIASLRAQLEKDEATARAVQWDGSTNRLDWGLPASATVDVGGDQFYAGDRTVAEHIARHDPARELRDVAAKRQIVDAYEHWQGRADSGEELSEFERGSLAGLYSVCRTLAEAHPDYRAERRP